MTIVNPIRHGVRKIYFDLIDSLLSTDIQWEQYIGGISDTHFFLTQSLLGLTNFFDSSIFLTKYFRTQTVFRPRIFRINFISDLFQTKIFFRTKILGGSTFFRTQKLFRLKNLSDLFHIQNLFRLQIFCWPQYFWITMSV